MDKHTYHVGAKPAIERLVRNCEEKRPGDAKAGIYLDLMDAFEEFWSHDEFERHMDNAVERYCRIVEARDASRRCGLRLEHSVVLGMKLDLVATANSRLGEG